MDLFLPLLASLLLGFFAYLLVTVFPVAFDKDLRKVPGPFSNRFSEWPLKWQVLSGTRSKYIHALHQRYGHIVRIAPREISASDIQSLRDIHKVGSPFIKAKWYQKGSPIQTNDDVGGIFVVRDRKKANARRKLFQQAGTRAAVHEWEPIIIGIVRQAVAKIKRDAANGSADLVKWWSLMTTDVIGSLAFGEPFRVVENEELLKDIETVMVFFGLKAELPASVGLIQNVSFPGIGRFIDISHRLTAYGQTAVENTKASSKGGFKTLFSKMVPEDVSEQPFPDSLIAQESANVIAAGSDTTAMVLVYLVYAVLQNPGIKRKLLDEVATISATPSWEELEGKEYLNNVVQETLRLHPPVPGSLPRTVPDEGAMLGGYMIPGGSVASTQAYTLHRDENVYQDPEIFNPDRWVSPTAAMKEHFIAFGGMARVCVGQNIARLELLHAVTEFFRECPDAQIAASTTEKSLDIIEYFSVKPAGGKFEITTR